jgi:hypothetical protein
MQDRRYRPGDVLEDYCPRERRITDHAIVAMIEEDIRRTRCGSCDAEHEYKEGKIPAPRRKTQPPALFTQVLEGLSGPTPPHPVAAVEESASAPEPGELRRDKPPESTAIEVPVVVADPGVTAVVATSPVAAVASVADADAPPEDDDSREHGGFRRSLIRATFPRADGQASTPRSAPEFTIQSLNNRRNGGGQRHAGGQNKFRGGRRRPGGGSQDHLGPMRFRDHGQQTNNNQGGQGQGGGRRRRGGKKNR